MSFWTAHDRTWIGSACVMKTMVSALKTRNHESLVGRVQEEKERARSTLSGLKLCNSQSKKYVFNRYDKMKFHSEN